MEQTIPPRCVSGINMMVKRVHEKYVLNNKTSNENDTKSTVDDSRVYGKPEYHGSFKWKQPQT